MNRSELEDTLAAALRAHDRALSDAELTPLPEARRRLREALTDQPDRAPRPAHASRRSALPWRPLLAAAAAVLVAVTVGVTLRPAGRTTSPADPSASTSVTTASPTASAGTTPTPTTTSAAASPSATPTAGSTVSGPATTAGAALVPVLLTDPVRAQLVAAYDAAMGYPPGWVTGLRPGVTLLYEDPASGERYAWTTFVAAADAPLRVSVGLQDGGSRTALRQPAGGAWQVGDICTMPAFLAVVGPLPNGGHC